MFVLRGQVPIAHRAWWAVAIAYCVVGVHAFTVVTPEDVDLESPTELVHRTSPPPPPPLPPPVFIVIDTPVNGSTVRSLHFELTYTLNTAPRGAVGGRQLTPPEVDILRDRGVSMCFGIEDGNAGPPAACGPLAAMGVIDIVRLTPGIWNALTATLSDGAVDDGPVAAMTQEKMRRDSPVTKDTTAWEDAGDSVTVWVGLNDGHPLRPDSMCGKSACLDDSALRSAFFDSVYSSRLWDLAGSRSGIGSEVASTHEIRLALEQVISSYGITSMLDAPCGDLTWMPLVRGIDQVRYTGADISAKVLEGNWGKYPAVEATGPTSTAFGTGAGFRNAVFVQADLVDAVPLSADGGSHDLIFVRDLMIHLPPRHNLKIIDNIQASGARLFMATTYLDGDDNRIADTFKPISGHFINVALPPYCLRPPDALFKDFTGTKDDKRMALWELDPGRPLIGGSGEHCGHVTWS